MRRRRPAWVAALVLAAACAATPASRAGRTDFLPALRLESVGPVRASIDQLQGRVVLVNFMATWCFPCLQELPEMIAVQRRFEAQGFSVVLVGMDLEGATVLEPFAEHYALPFPLLLADAELRKGETAFGLIRQLPTTVLLGRDGAALAAYAGVSDPATLEAAIASALR